MTRARDIADERLARGEITIGDHAQIVSTIVADEHGTPTPLKLVDLIEPEGYMGTGMLLLAAAIVFLSLGGPVTVLAYVSVLGGIALCGSAVYLAVTRLSL